MQDIALLLIRKSVLHQLRTFLIEESDTAIVESCLRFLRKATIQVNSREKDHVISLLWVSPDRESTGYARIVDFANRMLDLYGGDSDLWRWINLLPGAFCVDGGLDHESEGFQFNRSLSFDSLHSSRQFFNSGTFMSANGFRYATPEPKQEPVSAEVEIDSDLW